MKEETMEEITILSDECESPSIDMYENQTSRSEVT